MEGDASLYDRRLTAGVGPWAETYGGRDDHFVMERYHDGFFVDGQHRGKPVKDVIDAFHGVLCRIVQPYHPRLREAACITGVTGVDHVGRTVLHETIVQLMEALKEEYDALGIGPGRVLLASSGSIANDMAFRLAQAYTRSGRAPAVRPPSLGSDVLSRGLQGLAEHDGAIYLSRAYHGAGILGNATTDAPGWRPSQNWTALRGEFRHVEPGWDDGAQKDGLQKLREILMGFRGPPWAGPKLIFEDIQGVGGSFRNPGETFLTEAVNMVAKKGGVVINDEVQTGMRRGSYLSVPQWLRRHSGDVGQFPLLITLAKALANGVPLGAVLVPEVIVDDMRKNPSVYGNHWDTFSENAHAAGQALAVRKIYHEEHLDAKTPIVRANILSSLTSMVDRERGPITEIRGDGLMIGVALKDPTHVEKAVKAAPEFGLLIGKGSDALRVAPLADTPPEVAWQIGERLMCLIDFLGKPSESTVAA